jgi:hypothetical protein
VVGASGCWSEEEKLRHEGLAKGFLLVIFHLTFSISIDSNGQQLIQPTDMENGKYQMENDQ